jgi:hypothetical protein
VIVRGDVPLGVIVAQTIHAAGESSPGPSLPADTRAVALAAKDEAELLDLERQLIECGIPHVAIREPDTPYLGALMAIGIAPMSRTTQTREVLRRFPLIR